MRIAFALLVAAPMTLLACNHEQPDKAKMSPVQSAGQSGEMAASGAMAAPMMMAKPDAMAATDASAASNTMAEHGAMASPGIKKAARLMDPQGTIAKPAPEKQKHAAGQM